MKPRFNRVSGIFDFDFDWEGRGTILLWSHLGVGLVVGLNRMNSYSLETLVACARRLREMSIVEQAALADQIHETQPHLFLATLALSQDGVSPELLEHTLHTLMFVHLVVTHGRKGALPVATIEDVAMAIQRLEARVRQADLGPGVDIDQVLGEHSDPMLSAYVLGYLRDQGVTGVTDAQVSALTFALVAIDLYVGADQAFRKSNG